MSVLACAVNECLLQSHDGVIRVAPAVQAGHKARFTLHATGGFVVSTEIGGGVPQVIAENWPAKKTEVPWPTCDVLRGVLTEGQLGTGIQTLATAPGDLVLLTPTRRMAEGWECVPERPARNAAPKTHRSGHPTLGLPRMF